ncbi:MAG: sigma-70 family RNA polymerase sigma factor [Planctomycetota bacterium]
MARGGSVRGWLAEVTRNAVRKRWRGEGRRRAREEDAARDEALPSTLDVVERFSTQQAVGRAVLSLSEPYRRTVLLRYWEDLTLREIAERTGVAISTVDWRLRRGLDDVRASLERDAGGERDRVRLALVALAQPPKTALLNGSLSVGLVAAAAVVVAAGLAAWRSDRSSAPVDLRSDESGAADLVKLDVESLNARDVSRQTTFPPSASMEPDREPRGALVVRLAADGGNALPDVPLRLVDEPVGGASNPSPVRRTGLDGTVRFESLRARTWTVVSPFGVSARVDVAEGTETEAVLRAPAGPALEGRVVDGAEEPVAGASVWLAPDGANAWVGSTAVATYVDDEPVATTDAEGRFALPTIGRARTVGAFAPGRAPSLAIDLGEPSGMALQVTLRLEADGGVVVGRILDPSGEPLAGADVFLDAFSRLDGERVDAPHLRTRTGPDGRYRFDSVRPGRPDLLVRTTGFAATRAQVDVVAGATSALDVTVESGARVEGIIRDPDGAPVEGALVHGARRRWNDLPDSRFAVATRTDELGRYALDGVRRGAVWLTVDAGDAGFHQELLAERVEALARVDVVLERGAEIAGQVVDGDGQPVPGIVVECVAEGTWSGKRRSTDDEGRFLFPACQEVPHGLRFLEAGSLVARRRAEPGEEEITISLEASVRPTAELRGTVVDAAGRPVEARSLVLVDADTGRSASVSARSFGSGTFRAGPLRAGRYRVHVVTADHPAHEVEGVVELRQSKAREIGLVELGARGWVRVGLAATHASEVENARVRIVDESGGTVRAWAVPVPAARAPFTAALPAGDYRIIASADGHAPIVAPFTVASDEVRSVDVELVRGVDLRFEWPLAPNRARRTAYRLEVCDPAGVPLIDKGVERSARGPAAIGGLALAPGSYTFTLSSSDGARADGAFQVLQEAGSPVLVRCPLPDAEPRSTPAPRTHGVPR